MNTVLYDLYMPIKICFQPGKLKKALPLLHSLFFPQLDVVSLIDRFNLFAGFSQNRNQRTKDILLDILDAKTQNLRNQHMPESIDGQAWKSICFSENETTIGKIVSHHHAAICHSIVQPANPK